MLYEFSLLKSFFLTCRLRLRRFAQTAFFMAAHSFGSYRKAYAKAVP